MSPTDATARRPRTLQPRCRSRFQTAQLSSSPTARPAPTPPLRSARASRGPRWRSRSDGDLRDLARAAARRRARSASSPSARPGRARAGPPRHRARARRRGHGALPGREDHHRPADRERLLLRLRVPRGRRRSPTPTSRASRPQMRSTSRPTRSSRARTSPTGEAIERFAAEGQDYKVELIEDLVKNEGVDTVSLYTNGPFTDLCRGPHAPDTSADQGLQAARASPAPTGAATATAQMLTRIYGTAFLEQGGPRRAPRAARGGQEARPPQARQASSTSSASTSSRRARRSGSPNGMKIWNALTELWRERERAARLQRGAHADPLRRRALEDSRATGTSTATTCTSPRSRSARWA